MIDRQSVEFVHKLETSSSDYSRMVGNPEVMLSVAQERQSDFRVRCHSPAIANSWASQTPRQQGRQFPYSLVCRDNPQESKRVTNRTAFLRDAVIAASKPQVKVGG